MREVGLVPARAGSANLAQTASRRALLALVLANGALALLHVRGYALSASPVEGTAAALLPLSLVAHVEALALLTGLALLPLTGGPRRRLALRVLAPLAFAALQVALFVDRTVFALFRHHLNRLTLEVVLSPSAVEVMGFDGTQIAMAALAAAALVAAEWAGLTWLSRATAPVPGRTGWRLAGVAVLVLLCTDLGLYAMAETRHRWDVMRAESAVPLHVVRLTEQLLLGLGLGPRPSEEISIQKLLRFGTLRYPLAPLRFRDPARRPTILWIVADSWRSDAFSVELTPRLWELGRRALVFQRHVSGGNETRLGTFSLFYGLPGPYFDGFLRLRRGPVLFSRLHELGYDLHVVSATSLAYVGASSTLLAEIPCAAEDRFEGGTDERDLAAAARAAAILREPSPRPRFVVLLLATTHAPYGFPPAFARHRPFAGIEFWSGPPGEPAAVHNRYRNAVGWLDQVVGELLDAARAPLEQAVIVMTSDHGQEFFEHGAWLHGSGLHPEQYRVPLLLRVPGVAPAARPDPTSHADLVPTLMELLGCESPASDYSSGRSLLSGAPSGPVLTCSRELQCGVVDSGDGLTVFPGEAGAFDVLDADLRPLTGPVPRDRGRREVAAALAELRRFLR